MDKLKKKIDKYLYTVEQSINGKYIAIDPVTLKQILHKLLNRIEVLEKGIT